MSSWTGSLTQGQDLLHLWIYIMSCLQMLKKKYHSHTAEQACRAGQKHRHILQVLHELRKFVTVHQPRHIWNYMTNLEWHYKADTNKKPPQDQRMCLSGRHIPTGFHCPDQPHNSIPQLVTYTLLYLPLHKCKMLFSPVSQKPLLYHRPSQKNQTTRATFLIRKIFSFCPSLFVIVGRSLTSG